LTHQLSRAHTHTHTHTHISRLMFVKDKATDERYIKETYANVKYSYSSYRRYHL